MTTSIKSSEGKARRITLVKRIAIAAPIVVTISAIIAGGIAGSQRASADVAKEQPTGVRLGKENDASLADYSPDGKTVLTRGGESANTAWLWDTATGKPIGTPLRHDDVLYAWAFSPDSKTVVTGSGDTTARLWNAATGKPTGAPLQHQGPVRDVTYSPDGKTVLTGSDDKTARVWDATTGRPIGAPLPHPAPVYDVAYSPDGKTVLTADGKTTRLWELATRKPIGAPLPGVAVAFSPDGKMLLTRNQDQTARIWDVKAAKPVGALLRHEECIDQMAFSPDGKRVLTGSEDGTARLWDAATGKPISAPLRHRGAVYAVAYSPDGKTVLTGSFDRTARLWDAATGKPIGAPLQHQDVVWAVAYSPDGKTALTGSWDKTVRLWAAATGKPIGRPLQHQGRVDTVLYSPNGQTILAGSLDSAARLWPAPAPPQAPQPLSAPDRSVVASQAADVSDMPDAGDLSLIPAAMSDLDSAPPEGVVIPGGQGDRAVVTDSDEHGRGDQVARKSAVGGTKWVTPLAGQISRVRPPYVAADADRIYVTHYNMRKAGVTAFDSRTGKSLWHSSGPADHLLLSGDLLLAVDCSVGVDGNGGGRFLMARRTTSGKEAFRVVLPAGSFEPEIAEVAGLFLLKGWAGSGPSFLIDRTGRVRHRLDRHVVAVMAAGDDRLVLTSRDVVRLGADGPPRWAVEFAGRRSAEAGGIVQLAGGHLVAFLYGPISDSGVQVLRLDPTTGRKLWQVNCQGLGVGHSEYEHHAVVEVSGGRLKVTSRGSAGTFVEALDPQTGRSVGRRVMKRCL